MKIQQLHTLYTKYPSISTDTRNIKSNSLFFALKGNNFNGNMFAEEALDKGAKYCIVDEKEFVTEERIIYVEDVLKTLQKLANHHRKYFDVKIIALTGSNGKTTTKELIYIVLSKKYNVVATKGNLNNHIGVPLTLLSITKDTEIAVIEMGANHPKEIAFLTSLVEPDYGYITNFGKAHLEGFGSIEGVIEAKSELYDYLIDKDKLIFVNPHDSIQLEKTKQAKTILFSDHLNLVNTNPFLQLNYNNTLISSNLIGDYNFSNMACAITIGDYFNVPVQDIKIALEDYVPTNNRSQIIKKGTNSIILDAYNANPTSMHSALSNLSLMKHSSKYLILGDMFELGDYSLQEHQSLVDKIIRFGFTNVCLVGDNFAKTKSHFRVFNDFEKLSIFLSDEIIEDSLILIKGSRGMKLEHCLDIL